MLNSIHQLSLNAAITADFCLKKNSRITTDLKNAQKSEVDILTHIYKQEQIPMSRACSFFVSIGSFILGRNLNAYLTSHNANLKKLLEGINRINRPEISPILRAEYRRLEHINYLLAKKIPYQTTLPFSEDEQLAKILTFQNDCEVVKVDSNNPSTQVAKLAQDKAFISLQQDFTMGVVTTTLSIGAIAFIANKYFSRR